MYIYIDALYYAYIYVYVYHDIISNCMNSYHLNRISRYAPHKTYYQIPNQSNQYDHSERYFDDNIELLELNGISCHMT